MSAPLFQGHGVLVTPWTVESGGATTDVRSIVSVRTTANRGNLGLLALGLLMLSVTLPWAGCLLLCLDPLESDASPAVLSFLAIGFMLTGGGWLAFKRREVWIVAGGVERRVLSVSSEQEHVALALVQAIQHAMLNAQR